MGWIMSREDAKEAFRQKLIRFLVKMDSNGCYLDEDCDAEGIPRLTEEIAVGIVAGWARDQISGDINAGHVPANVGSFSELHDHVDANGYGGAFEFGFDSSDDCLRFWNAVQGKIDDWVKDGMPEDINHICDDDCRSNGCSN